MRVARTCENQGCVAFFSQQCDAGTCDYYDFFLRISISVLYISVNFRKVQPPATDVFSDWLDQRQWFGGGRRRTSSALAILARATLGFVKLFLYCVGGFEWRIQAH